MDKLIEELTHHLQEYVSPLGGTASVFKEGLKVVVVLLEDDQEPQIWAAEPEAWYEHTMYDLLAAIL